MTRITRGTTNVFADLCYPEAAERQTKTRLALAVNELVKARKLKQREIGALLGVPQPKVSALKNYRLDQFSVERLMEFLTSIAGDNARREFFHCRIAEWVRGTGHRIRASCVCR